MGTITNWAFTRTYLQALSKVLEVPFVNCEICHGVARGTQPELIQLRTYAAHSAKSQLEIIAQYLDNINYFNQKDVLSEQKNRDLVVLAAAGLRDVMYDERPYHAPDMYKETARPKLSQNERVWLMLNDIVAPIAGLKVADLKVENSEWWDFGAYYTTLHDDNTESEPTLTISSMLHSEPVIDAYLLTHATEALGGDLAKVATTIYEDDGLRNKLHGFAKMVYQEPAKATKFMLTFAGIADVSHLLPVDNLIKLAQAQGQGGSSPPSFGSFFNARLTEDMLSAVRGTDYDAHNRLEALHKDLWNRVAVEKKRRGKVDMSLEDLLRVQGDEFRVKPGITLQGLLGDERIW